jgi:hypothetical protein
VIVPVLSRLEAVISHIPQRHQLLASLVIVLVWMKQAAAKPHIDQLLSTRFSAAKYLVLLYAEEKIPRNHQHHEESDLPGIYSAIWNPV